MGSLSESAAVKFVQLAQKTHNFTKSPLTGIFDLLNKFSRREGRVHTGAMSSELVRVRVQHLLLCGMPPSGLANRVYRTTMRDERFRCLQALIASSSCRKPSVIKGQGIEYMPHMSLFPF